MSSRCFGVYRESSLGCHTSTLNLNRETSNKALSTINQANLVPFLMSFLVYRGKLPLSVVASAGGYYCRTSAVEPSPIKPTAQCLYVLTEDNPPAAEELRANGSYTSVLLSITRDQQVVDDVKGLTLQVLTTGILRNISPLPSLTAVSAVNIEDEIVLPLLQPLLTSISLPEASQQIQELVEKRVCEPLDGLFSDSPRGQTSMPQIEDLSLKNTPRSDYKPPIELGLERFENRLRTVQLGLEILTSVCATLPDSEVPHEDGAGGEENEDEEMDRGDDRMATDETPTPSQSNHSQFAFLISPLLSLIKPTHLSFPPPGSPSVHPPTTSALGAIHLCALECLNNLFLSLATSHRPLTDTEKAQGTTIWSSLWGALEKVGDPRSAKITKEQKMFWETAIGVLWGASTVFKGAIVPEEGQVQLLVTLSETCTGNDQMKVKFVGTLECLAQHPQSIGANRVRPSFSSRCTRPY